MERKVGTVSRGIRCPIIREGDDLASIVTESVLEAAKSDGFKIKDRDIIGITESILARAQGNYATTEAIAQDVKRKFGKKTIGVLFPIFSRNRFAIILKGIAMGAEKIVLMLQYPADEVGNELVSLEEVFNAQINPYTDVFDESYYRKVFGYPKHQFTGVDYVHYYREIVESCGTEVEIIFSNRPESILDYSQDVLVCNVHESEETKALLKEKKAQTVYGLDDLLTESIDGSGFNESYGLMGSNTSTEDSVKLFPRNNQAMVETIQKQMAQKTGKQIEVLVYGDGAFKDPIGGIWELADPVVSPAYTAGLEGTPHEIKLKYLADNDFKELQGDQLEKAIKKEIQKKDDSKMDDRASLGTTPRRLSDLVGTLCDLTSGSGDKGTPIVHIQGYFDNMTDQ